MSGTDLERLTRENEYLKLRCAQLQEDVIDLGGQVLRLQQQFETISGRRAAAHSPNPLSGGQ